MPWGSSYIPTNREIGLMAAGVPINDDTALAITTVFACVGLLADAVSTLPLCCYKRTKDRSKRVVEPAPLLVSDPWPEGSLQDWLTQVMVSLTLRGNFYGQIVDRDARGYPTTIMPLHPDRIFARRDERSGKRVYRLNGDVIPTADMVHIPALLVPGSFVGLNPVEYMRSSWGLASAAEKYGGAFFSNSANPSGVIEVAEDLDENETLELARAWRQAHGGVMKGQLPAVLTGGATWKQLSIAPNDAQFLETRGFQRSEIASFFRVPEHMLGMQDRTSSWGTGIEQMEIGFAVNTLRPWLNRIETYLSNLLPPSQIARFNLSGRLRGDSQQRANYYTAMINAGLMCADEARELEDLPPLPNDEGQIFYRPSNYTTTTVMKENPPAPGSSGGVGGGADQGNPDAPSPDQDTNPGGRGQGGGDPNNSKNQTGPNVGNRSGENMEVHVHVPIDKLEVSAPIVNVEAARAPDVHVEVAAPEVHVEAARAPDVRVEVAAPEVNIAAPPAPDVTVNPIVHVEAARAPEVTVNVEPSPARQVVRRVVRDKRGQITEVVESEVDE